MKDDFHNKPFDEATKFKLEIFGECFKEWLPVFIYNPTISHIYVYDFFAGAGQDSLGNHGSPLILLNKAKGAAMQLIGLEAGKTFMRDLGLEVGLYREGDVLPLVDAVNASPQTQLFKDTLTGILNVSYI